VLRKLFGLKSTRQQGSGENCILLGRSWALHDIPGREEKCKQNLRGHLEDMRVAVRMLKWMLKNWDGRSWTGYNWFGT
jgi:hypothetical protein